MHLELDSGSADGPDVVAQRIGRRRFIAGSAAVAGAAAATTVLPDGFAHAALPDGASKFVPLQTAVRLADTRPPSAFTKPASEYFYSRISANQIRVNVAGQNGVPAGAVGVVLTVTGINRSEPNFVTVFPSGTAVPTASNLNLINPGEINANLVTVKVGSGGSVDVFQRVACDVIVDVLGYYEAVESAAREGRFIALAAAQRAKDTRPNSAGADTFTVVDVTRYVPTDASSVVINLTATETTGPGYFTAVPMSVNSAPSTSSLNVTRPGDTRGSGVIVPVSTIGGKRQIKIYTLTPAKIIVDVVGYFTSESSALSQVGLFVPIEPTRLLDTRDPGELGKLWPRWMVEATLPSDAAANASAVVLNVTGADSRGPGYLTVSAARQPVPETSNLNFSGPGQYVPNHVITPVTATHGLQVYSSHGTHVIVDMAGYFTGIPKIPTLSPYINPPPPSVGPPWTLNVPKIGLQSLALDGAPSLVDLGHSWHWTGTGLMGQDNAHVALFAHRTDAGGPYRNLDQLANGDLFTIVTNDRREFTYRMVRRDLTDAQNSNILDATRFHPGTTLSLIACTVGNDRTKSRWPDVWAPTSLKYRIIVTGELVSWREF